jgi:hypothetical protein
MHMALAQLICLTQMQLVRGHMYVRVYVCFTGTLQLRKGNNLFGLQRAVNRESSGQSKKGKEQKNVCVCVCVCVVCARAHVMKGDAECLTP